MFPLSSHQKYYLYKQATDMRKSFNGLVGLVNNEMKSNPLDGSVYIFINKRRTHIKLLVWDRTGFVIYYKRLERGTFEIPKIDHGVTCIRWDELLCILEGVALSSIKKRKRFSMSKA